MSKMLDKKLKTLINENNQVDNDIQLLNEIVEQSKKLSYNVNNVINQIHSIALKELETLKTYKSNNDFIIKGIKQ